MPPLNEMASSSNLWEALVVCIWLGERRSVGEGKRTSISVMLLERPGGISLSGAEPAGGAQSQAWTRGKQRSCRGVASRAGVVILWIVQRSSHEWSHRSAGPHSGEGGGLWWYLLCRASQNLWT